MKRELWAACVNLAGCNDVPARVKFDRELEEYFDSAGNMGFSLDRLVDEGRVVFVSVRKSEVAAFIAGAKAVYHILDSISGKRQL